MHAAAARNLGFRMVQLYSTVEDQTENGRLGARKKVTPSSVKSALVEIESIVCVGGTLNEVNASGFHPKSDPF